MICPDTHHQPIDLAWGTDLGGGVAGPRPGVACPGRPAASTPRPTVEPHATGSGAARRRHPRATARARRRGGLRHGARRAGIRRAALRPEGGDAGVHQPAPDCDARAGPRRRHDRVDEQPDAAIARGGAERSPSGSAAPPTTSWRCSGPTNGCSSIAGRSSGLGGGATRGHFVSVDCTQRSSTWRRATKSPCPSPSSPWRRACTVRADRRLPRGRRRAADVAARRAELLARVTEGRSVCERGLMAGRASFNGLEAFNEAFARAPAGRNAARQSTETRPAEAAAAREQPVERNSQPIERSLAIQRDEEGDR